MINNRRSLYFLILVLISAVVTTATGGGLFNQSAPWYSQWQHQAFLQLCHQMPGRSFWINGQPMAVCSRCLGVYGGFLAGWIFLPLVSKWNLTAKVFAKKVVLITVFVNILDVAGNMLGLWENTLVSRLLFGSVMGCTVALIFSGIFFNKKVNSTKNHHGRISAAEI